MWLRRSEETTRIEDPTILFEVLEQLEQDALLLAPGDVPIFGPVSLMVSSQGYFLDYSGDQPMGYPMSKPTGKLVRGRFKKKNRAQNYERLCPLGDVTNPDTYIERRSVLEYVQFGHNPGQHCKLRLTLIYGGKLTSRGYYCDSGRKPDQKQIGELQTHHVSSARVSIGELQTHHVSSTSVSIYARTACRI
mgnify:CR=1 FL=1